MKYIYKSNKISKSLQGLNDCIWKTFRRKNAVNGCVKISVLVSALNDILPNKEVCVKEEPVNSNIMQSGVPFYATLKHKKTRALRFSVSDTFQKPP